MKRLLFLLLVLPSLVMAQEKIANKIYKYGDVYHSIEGATLISFDEAKAKTMSKTLEYFSEVGANIKSYTSLFLPGTVVSEDGFASKLDENNIQTLIFVDIIDAEVASVSRTTSTAFASANKGREIDVSSDENSWSTKAEVKSTSTAASITTTKNANIVTELNLRLTIFSKKL